MTFLYDTGYSVVLLRPKNEVKLLTQSAANSSCMGKWPVPSLADFIRHVLVVPYICTGVFFQRGWSPRSGEIDSGTHTTDQGAGAKKSKN